MLVSQADFARAAEVSRKTITTWKSDGLLVLQGTKVDLAATVDRMRRLKRDGPVLADRVTAYFSGRVTGNTPTVTPRTDAVTSAPAVTPPARAPETAEERWRSNASYMGGLSNLGGDMPAIAGEIAQLHGLPAAAAEAFFTDMCAATSAQVAGILTDLNISPEEVEDFCCDADDVFTGELIPPEMYRRPGETEDQHWERVFPKAEAA